MKTFQGRDYLLHGELALSLYEEFAKPMPIFDFHCHLSPKQIAENHRFETITEAWLGKNGAGDHYKWRLLREYGVEEKYITGEEDDYERFLHFASAMPSMFGNPVYEWTHLELKRYFGIDLLINEKNAREIYDRCNEKLKTLTAREMLKLCNVSIVFTTDDPADDLHYHEIIAKDKDFAIKVLPCWRPDRYLHIANNAIFEKAMVDLEKSLGRKVESFDALLKALDERLEYFAVRGCKATDHGLDTLRFSVPDKELASVAFDKVRSGLVLTEEEIDAYESTLLIHLGKQYVRLGFAQQYHIGAIRNNAEINYKLHGPDFGYDATGDDNIAPKLSKLLSTLQKENALPRTVLYALNEKDYCSMVTLMNSFQGQGKGHIQFGAAWWFNDHHDGIRKQIRALMAGGLLSTFIGMLTDSRSFLSYPRHEYFRRLLVDEIASLVEDGRYPYDREQLGKIIEDICYHNAIAYFLGK